jgi:hypothetical protein
MLLIEEIDTEVETLDSPELLGSSVLAAKASEIAPALQLAAAVASSAENRLPIHAAEDAAPAEEPEVRTATRAQPTKTFMLAAVLAVMVSTSWSLMHVVGLSPASAVFPGGQLPQTVQATVLAPVEPDAARVPLGTESTLGREDGRSVETTGRARRARALSGVPTVDGILISGPRRLAIVSGEVVAAGDVVGTRAVTRIERNGVVLKDRAGRETYIAIRARKPTTVGS